MLVLFMHTSPLNFLLGPSLYFYVRSMLTDCHKLKWWDIVHFIPFTLVTLDLSPYFFLSIEEKRKIIDLVSNDMNTIRIYVRGYILNHYNYTLARWFSWVGYLLYILYILIRNRPRKKNYIQYSPSQYRLVFTWLLTLTVFLLAVLLPSFLVIQHFHSGKMNMNGNQYLSMPAFVLSMVIYVVGCLSILLYPQILYGLPQLSHPEKRGRVSGKMIHNTQVPPATTQEPPQTLARTEMEDDPLAALAQDIEQYIHDEKPYLEPDFSISSISLKFQVPQHHIHYCFSKIIQCGFPAYKNRLRINYAKELLAEGHGTKLTIDAIGKLVGFSAKMNFYTAFKKETGLTPKQYLESLHGESKATAGE